MVSSIPIVDFSQLNTTQGQTKLRDAIFSIGFLYLVNTGLEDLIEETYQFLPEIFALSDEDKDACNMRNSPSFLGYTTLGGEMTASKQDLREQFDFGTPCRSVWNKGEALWRRLEGPSQYPSSPEFKNAIERYISETSRIANQFLHHVAECLDLPSTIFHQFLGNMDRLKFVKYPPAPPGSQGVGPHKDSTGLFTFLSQDQVGGLQVLSKSGEWLDAPPLKGSLVINVQQGFEAITGGLCPATIHRVISPQETTRYSMPFFLGVKLDLTLEELKTSAAQITARIPYQNSNSAASSIVQSEFLSPLYSCFGEAQLRNRVISHPEVGQRWYPDLFKKYSKQNAA